MAVQREIQRVEVARGRLGLTRKQLASAIGVSTTALDNWSDGIPSARLKKLAAVLHVPEVWIANGREPPLWYVVQAMATGRGDVDWATLPQKAIQDIWRDALEGALLERLLDRKCNLRIPNHVRVKRWEFATHRWDSFLSQFNARQLEALARELGMWPDDDRVRKAVQAGLPTTSTSPTGESSAEVDRWRVLIDSLESGARNFHSARNDRRRQLQRQSEVWNLLMNPQLGEALLAARAIVPVLGACVRAAYSAEILSAMRVNLDAAVENALRSEFRGRAFTIQDLGRYLERRRGLRLVGRRRMTPAEHRRRMLMRDSISEDWVLRALKKILEAGELPLKLKIGSRKWVMGAD